MHALIDSLLDQASKGIKTAIEIDDTGGRFAKKTVDVILVKTNDRLEYKTNVRKVVSQNGNYTEKLSSVNTGSVDPIEFSINDGTTNLYRIVFKHQRIIIQVNHNFDTFLNFHYLSNKSYI